jgi:hypothetical protein
MVSCSPNVVQHPDLLICQVVDPIPLRSEASDLTSQNKNGLALREIRRVSDFP